MSARRRSLPAIIPMPEVREYSRPVEHRAFELVAYLESQTDGVTSSEIRGHFQWTASQFDDALSCARDVTCMALELAIPHPVPTDGWRYRLTGAWLSTDGSPAIAAGTGHAVAQIEARLRSVLRDAVVARKHLDPQSINGRKVNALTMHVSHILSVLAEIAGDEQQVAS